MNKREFALKMINEIEQIAKLGFHYQAFALLAVLDSFLWLECDTSVFQSNKVKLGLNNIRQFYSPRKTIWLMEESTSKVNHFEPFKETIALDIFKTIDGFKTVINEVEIAETPYLEVTEV